MGGSGSFYYVIQLSPCDIHMIYLVKSRDFCADPTIYIDFESAAANQRLCRAKLLPVVIKL